MKVDPTIVSEAGTVKTVIKEEGRSAALYTGLTILTRAGSVLLVPVFWTKLTPYDYGIVAAVEMVASFLAIAFNLGLEQSISRFYYEWDDNRRKNELGTLWVVAWGSTAILVWPMLIAGSLIVPVAFSDIDFWPCVFWGIVGLALNSMGTVPFMTLRMMRRPGLYAIYSIVSFILTTGLSVYFVVGLNKGVAGLLVARAYAYAGIAGLGGIFMLVYSNPGFSGKGIKECLRFSLPTLPVSYVNTLGNLTDRFLLQTFAGIEALGIYAVCQQFASLIGSVHASLKMSFSPLFMKMTCSKDSSDINKAMTAISLYTVPYYMAAAGIILFVEPFVKILKRTEYLSVIPYVPAFVLIALLSSIQMYYTPGIVLSKKTKYLTVPTLISLIVLVLSSLLLIRPYQLWGVFATRLLSLIASSAVSIWFSIKLYPLPYDWKRLCIALCGVLGVWAWSARINTDSIVLLTVIQSAVFAVYVGSLLAMLPNALSRYRRCEKFT